MKKLNKRNINLAVVVLIFCSATLMSLTSSKYFELVKNIDLYAQLYKELNEGYVDDVEPAKLMRNGMDAMLKSLDPYTNFISEGQIEGYRMNSAAASGDIGIELIQKEDKVVVSTIHEDLPAFKAGLIVGDVIDAVDGASAKGRSVEDVKKILQGQPGSELELTINREGASSKTYTLTRDKKTVKSVPFYGMLDENTAYLKLKTFLNAGCTQEVKKAIKEMESENEVKQLIFDLRHNGGGLLRESITMVNLFVGKGEVVVSTQGKVKEWQNEYKTTADAEWPDLPLVILTDGRSASASEIFSGVMQDLDRGVVIGTQTFGKGLVQQTKDVGYNSKLKLTVAKYFLPSGRCVQAIDYSGRYKDGAIEVPDSLRTKFTTKNGRLVFDGSGVDPDIELDKTKYSNITNALLKNNLIFDFASSYKRNNPQIAEAKSFRLSDEIYSEFQQFLKDKNYEYTTNSEKIIEKLKETAEHEKYKSVIDGDLRALTEMVGKEKQKDLIKFKPEISKILTEEIVRRYYFETGSVEVSLDNDEYIDESISLFSDMERYSSILSNK